MKVLEWMAASWPYHRGTACPCGVSSPRPASRSYACAVQPGQATSATSAALLRIPRLCWSTRSRSPTSSQWARMSPIEGGPTAEARDEGLDRPFLFKLHAPDNYIVGGGYLSGAIKDLPVSLAWECFGPGNGAASLAEMRRQISRYRGGEDDPYEDYKIGCIILNSPFHLDEDDWIPSPADLAPNIVQGKTYNLTTGTGKVVWDEIQLRLRVRELDVLTADTIAETEVTYGDPVLARPRLGQGAFRALVTETYERRCAITREKALPVLDAAHIRPVAVGGTHALPNGLLFRTDVHRLFDAGFSRLRGVVLGFGIEHLRRSRRRLHPETRYPRATPAPADPAAPLPASAARSPSRQTDSTAPRCRSRPSIAD